MALAAEVSQNWEGGYLFGDHYNQEYRVLGVYVGVPLWVVSIRVDAARVLFLRIRPLGCDLPAVGKT